MSTRLGAILSVGTLLVACSTQPAQTDKVRDAATAISIAKKDCTHDRAQDGLWQAHFSAGLWEVTQDFDADKSGCNFSTRVLVWADDGKTKPCEFCVVET